MFRFHTGSIKRLWIVKPSALSCTGFDSILVRLKGKDGRYTLKRQQTGFDSILVRLKDYQQKRLEAGESFDSILVRLKASANAQFPS